ncbi:hypothetical protein SLEP1_g38812 [Rubroshorea leprosula]|uniref:Uncharacterized protein n=1 Tax=Rubroshorea leprosula TaxID=152421 RepID=A0AAV5KYB6_9ROSI|nr:hypothetical protein SLEP1_g38812 [Rubroshorea leprosula]
MQYVARPIARFIEPRVLSFKVGKGGGSHLTQCGIGACRIS